MEKEMRLFGVRIMEGKIDKREEESNEEEMMRKSQSMENLSTINKRVYKDQGYLSDGGLAKSSRAKQVTERKKGTPWTAEEHLSFLIGMEKLGKGDWKGISKNFVRTRTASQIASHAQKYFLRQNNPAKKRRSSLFDAVTNDLQVRKKNYCQVCSHEAQGFHHLNKMVGSGVHGIWKMHQFPAYNVPGQVFSGFNSCFNANVRDFQRPNPAIFVPMVASPSLQGFGGYHQVKASEGF
ncbi:hypothetical protein J5N97_029330 [Dioscorea zingiberensis]|uniref:Uncharacterized protein n=1 Tax=Dioscorea zingiberensis TaxID=325984 RepID=A0A9D5C141_9LILI|nr:hypothetical protein J5N97_029330 [Dioscorea zingiberensis]